MMTIISDTWYDFSMPRELKEWLQEFRQFALKGNMIDLAIGVIIGTAFGRVVSSLVSDILMPLLGLFVGVVDFSTLSLHLELPGHIGKPAEIKYGLFSNALLDFFFIALAVFFVIKGMHALRLSSLGPPDKKCPYCAMSIPSVAKKCGHCTSEV